MNETSSSPLSSSQALDVVVTTTGSSINTAPVKRWQRWLIGAVTLSLAGVLAAPPVFAQDADDEEEEEAPPPKQIKKKTPAPAKAQPKQQKKSTKAEKDPSAEERALRGVVSIERGGQPIGLGAVLAGDGRVLTALSSLGPGNGLEARFADGTSVPVKLGHHDRVWDLALLVPQTGKWQEGMTASSRDPVRQNATIRAFVNTRGKVLSSSMTLKSHRALLGGDDKQLNDVLELGSRVAPNDLGTPIIDEKGRVVGIVGRGCAPNEGKACTPVAFGIPVHAIKNFLKSVPATAVQPSAWLGIQGVADTNTVAKGVRVTVVHPESPADEAHLRGGERDASDLILAVDGVPVTNPETLAEAIRSHSVGEKVPLLVFGKNKYRTVTVLLRAAPDPKAAPASSADDDLPDLEDAPARKPRK